MALKEIEKICPICGEPNNCQHDKGNCWCEKVSIPEHIFDLVPEDKKGKVCICKDCIDKYAKERINETL